MTLTGWIRHKLVGEKDAHVELPPSGLDARRPEILLVDATDLGVDQLPGLVSTLSEHVPARRMVVMHPDADAAGHAAHGRQRVSDADGPAESADVEFVTDTDDRHRVAARLGPGRTLKAVASDQAVLLLADLRQPFVWAGQSASHTSANEASAAEASADGARPLAADPIFVGGTGRSGTWTLGRMLGAHPQSVTVHTELRFHSENGGFPSVLSGTRTPQKFANMLQNRWFSLQSKSGGAKGLQLITSKGELRRALGQFLRTAEVDVPGALGQLMLDVVGPYVRGRDGRRWAETTPDNAAAADTLTTVLPMSRVVHTIRDGRDVAASVVTMPWGPNTFEDALEWWVNRVRAAHQGMSAADPTRVHTVRLEELVHVDRERHFAALVDFLGIADDAPLRQYFDKKLTADAAHVGRWRRELGRAQQDEFDRRYRQHLEQMAAEGVTLPVDPDVADSIARG